MEERKETRRYPRRYLKKRLHLFFIFLFLGLTCIETIFANENRMSLANKSISEGNYLKAFKLYQEIYNDIDEKGEVRAEALYLSGKASENLSLNLSKKAWTEIKPRKDGGYWDEDFINWGELKVYEKEGIGFKWNHLGQRYYYDGENYKKILRNFSTSEWVPYATFELIVLQRTEEIWEGNPEKPLNEIEKLEEIIRKFPSTGIRPKILLRMVENYLYLTRVHCDKKIGRAVYSPQKGRSYYEKAVKTFNTLDSEFSSSFERAKAEKLLIQAKRTYGF